MNSVPIDLTYAPGARLVVNNLMASDSLADRDSDLVLVELPGGIFLDVSWYPENEVPGAYYVTVFRRNDWDNPLRTAEAKTPESAAWLVGLLSADFSVRVGPTSCSHETVGDFFIDSAAIPRDTFISTSCSHETVGDFFLNSAPAA
jgi:hypothetical protein